MSMPAYSTADIEMLLSVCRRELGTAGIPDDTRLDESAWRGALAAALDHGLVGPLHNGASKTSSIPDDILSSIRSNYLFQVARNFQLTTALQEIIRGFTAAGIEVAIFKGPAVALMVYGQIAQREFTDLDLLVHFEDLKPAKLVLHRLGYQLSRDILDTNNEKDIQLIRDSDDTLVELHWALNPPNSRFPLEATGIWDRLETVCVFHEPIRTLSLEDTLIALCLHAAKHHWTSLKWIFDIARILTNKATTLDWDALSQRCSAVGCSRAVDCGIQLATLLFGVKAPRLITMQIQPGGSLSTLVEAVKNSLIQSTPLTRSARIASHIEIHDRFRDRFFVAVTQPVPELQRLLPEAAGRITSGPLRFITRPVRLLHLYGLDWLRTVIIGRGRA
jgi:hypothetical protein